MRIRLAENFRALFYAPFYATRELGFYAEQGVEVELLDSAAPGDAIAGLASGDIDVTWAGPMRVMRDREQQPTSGRSLVCFCEVVTRDPFFLVTRADAGPFRLQDLTHLRMGSVCEVVTPWLCLQQDLRDAGIDPDAVGRVKDQSMAANFEALRDGRLDVVQLFEPFVSRALEEGFGRIAHAASGRGPTSYTSLIATRDGVARNAKALAAMLRATAKMQEWLAAHNEADLARVAAPYFPQLPPALLLAGLQRYAEAGIWSRTPEISPAGFARLAQSVQSGGLVKALAHYEDCVATIPA
jgi:NitT/TauT family transport system substrate-binding protein